ncbi:Uncharacterized protein PBTT_05905 [Plasmodiophora brassicae]
MLVEEQLMGMLLQHAGKYWKATEQPAGEVPLLAVVSALVLLIGLRRFLVRPSKHRTSYVTVASIIKVCLILAAVVIAFAIIEDRVIRELLVARIRVYFDVVSRRAALLVQRTQKPRSWWPFSL